MALAPWTWMVYLATHNNAAVAGDASVARIRQAQLGDLQVVIQQSSPVRTVRRFVGRDPEVVEDLGKVDSGDPAVLLDFIRWAVATAPAAQYALVVWSHGSGWEPAEMVQLAQQQPSVVPVTAAELTQRGADDGHQVFFSSTLRRLLAHATPAERAIAFDDGSGHSLDTVELGATLAQAAGVIGRPFALLGMNACQMSSAEVAYQVRESVRVYVASEEDMPVQSWPYDDILTRLAAQPDMDASALGRLVVERYCAYFREHPLPWGQGGLPPGVTLTALDLAGAGRLVEAVRSLAHALVAHVGDLFPLIWGAHRQTYPFKFRMCDLGSFCAALASQPSAPPEVVAAAQAVSAILSDPALVVAQECTASVYDALGGVTTYLLGMEPNKPVSPYYAATDYAQATGWGDFLTAYNAAAS